MNIKYLVIFFQGLNENWRRGGTIPGIKCDVVGNEIVVKKTALQSVRNLVIHSLYTSYGDVATHSALKLKKNIAILNMFLSLALHLTFRKKIFPLDSFWDSFFWKIVKKYWFYPSLDSLGLLNLKNCSKMLILDIEGNSTCCLILLHFFENWFYEIFAPFFCRF